MGWGHRVVTFRQVYAFVEKIIQAQPGKLQQIEERFDMEGTPEEYAEMLWGLIESGHFTVKVDADDEIYDVVEVKHAEDGDHRTWPMREIL